MMQDFEDAWLGKKIRSDSFKLCGGKLRADVEEEIQPLKALMHECFGRSADVILSWPETFKDGIPYRYPQLTIQINGIMVCTGSILECMRTMLWWVKNYLDNRQGNAEQ